MVNSGLVFLAYAFLASSFLLFLSKLLTNKNHRKLLLPPGPKPWPIIGNLNLLGSVPHRSLHTLALKYGELMYLKFGSKPVLVASSPDMAKEFLKTHDSVFASRPPTAVGKYTSYDYSDMSWSPYGPYWRQARRIFMNEVFSSKRLETYEYLRFLEMKALISGICISGGGTIKRPILLRDHLSRYSISTMTKMVLGNEYFKYNDKNKNMNKSKNIVSLEKLRGMLNTWFFLGGVFNIGDWIPFLSRFDLQGYEKQMKELHMNFDRFNNYVLDDHLSKKITTNGESEFMNTKDMVDILLEMADDPNLEIQLSRDNIKALLQNLLLGGTDTSPTTIEWAMMELIRHPNLIEKATEELDRIIGRERWVKEDDYQKLPFLEAIIKETMRIHPLTTLLPPHYAIEDCNVAGYHVSKGTTVLINVWSMGRNPKYWDSPQEFLPERFLGINNDIDVTGQNFTLIPFGSGRRRCPGYKLGMRIVRSILANLLHGFHWKLPPGMKSEDICMEEIYGLSTCPKIPFSFIVEPRLPPYLY